MSHSSLLGNGGVLELCAQSFVIENAIDSHQFFMQIFVAYSSYLLYLASSSDFIAYRIFQSNAPSMQHTEIKWK